MASEKKPPNQGDDTLPLVSVTPEGMAAELPVRRLIRDVKKHYPGTSIAEGAGRVSRGVNTTQADIDAIIGSHRDQQGSRRTGGDMRGRQQRELAEKRGKPVIRVYEMLLRKGVSSRKAISKTAKLMQRTEKHSLICERKVRRYVYRKMKKDSS